MMRAWVFLLATGCAGLGTPKAYIEVGQSRGDGGFDFAGGNSFEDNHDAVGGFTDLSYDTGDTRWMSLGLEVPFGPEKVEIVTAHSAPLYAPLDSTPEIPVVTHAPEPAPTETPNRNLKILGMEIPTDTNPLLVLAIAVLVAAAGRWGWKKRQAMKKGGNGG